MTGRVQSLSLSSRDNSSAETRAGDVFRPYEMVQTWHGITMSESRPGGD